MHTSEHEGGEEEPDTSHNVIERVPSTNKKLTCKQKLHRWSSKIIHNSTKFFFFSVLIRLGFELYLEIVYGCLLNLSSFTAYNPTEVYSCVVTCIWLVLMAIFTLIVFGLAFYNQRLIRKQIRWSERVVSLTDELRDSKWSMGEHVLFLFRRALLAVLVIYIQIAGWAQLLIFILMSLILIAFKLIMKPYKSQSRLIQDVIMEMLIWTIALLFFSFMYKETELTSEGYGAIFGYICIALIVSIVIWYYVCLIVNSVINRIRKKTKGDVKKNITKKIIQNFKVVKNTSLDSYKDITTNHSPRDNLKKIDRPAVRWVHSNDKSIFLNNSQITNLFRTLNEEIRILGCSLFNIWE